MTFGQDYILDWQHLTKGFKYHGSIIPLIGTKGIWKPKVIDKYPISITSVQKSIYSNEFIDEETLIIVIGELILCIRIMLDLEMPWQIRYP